MIPQRNISLLSNRLANEGGRRIREDVFERDYCLAWFLAVLSQSELKTVLGFKGGTALKRCYFPDYRFSEDLDFTLLEAMPMEDGQPFHGQCGPSTFQWNLIAGGVVQRPSPCPCPAVQSLWKSFRN